MGLSRKTVQAIICGNARLPADTEGKRPAEDMEEVVYGGAVRMVTAPPPAPQPGDAQQLQRDRHASAALLRRDRGLQGPPPKPVVASFQVSTRAPSQA